MPTSLAQPAQAATQSFASQQPYPCCVPPQDMLLAAQDWHTERDGREARRMAESSRRGHITCRSRAYQHTTRIMTCSVMENFTRKTAQMNTPAFNSLDERFQLRHFWWLMGSFTAALCALSALALVSCSDPWPQAGCNSQHSGQSPNAGPKNGSVAWQHAVFLPSVSYQCVRSLYHFSERMCAALGACGPPRA